MDTIEPLEKSFEKAKEKACQFILDTQNKTDGGWPSQFSGERSSTWTTTHALWALIEYGLPLSHPSLKKGVNFLIDHQNSETGCWLERRLGEGINSTFITADAVASLSLVLRTNDQYIENFEKGLRRLIKIRNPDGGWGFVENHHSMVRSTTNAVASLALTYFNNRKLVDTVKTPIIKGTEWIEKARNADGGWGYSSRDNKSNVSCSAWAIWALSNSVKTGFTVNISYLENGIKWLLNHSEVNGGWIGVDEPSRPIGKDRTFPEIHGIDTPFVVMSLLNSLDLSKRLLLSNPKISKSIVRLIYAQTENGGWILERDMRHYGRTIGPRTWSTPYLLLALLKYEDICKQHILDIVDIILSYCKIPPEFAGEQAFFTQRPTLQKIPEGTTLNFPAKITKNINYQLTLFIENATDDEGKFRVVLEKRRDYIITPAEGFYRQLRPGDTDTIRFCIIPTEDGNNKLLTAYTYLCFPNRELLIDSQQIGTIDVSSPLSTILKPYMGELIVGIITTIIGILIGILLIS